MSFMKRNKHIIRSKKGVKFDNKRAHYLNMQEMYDKIYKDLVSAGLTCAYLKPLWRNEKGKVVDKEEEAFRQASKYELVHMD